MRVCISYKSALLFALVLSLFVSSAKSESLVVAGDDNFPPFSYLDDSGQIKGIDVDIVNELGRRLDVNFDVQLMPWKRLLLVTQRGGVFGSFSLFKTPEREAFAEFTGPLHYSTYVLFSHHESPLAFESLADLSGKKIGIEAGFSIGQEFDLAAKSGQFRLVELFSYEDIFRRLTNHGIDGFVGNDLVFSYKLNLSKQYLAKELFRSQRPILEAKPAYFVISKSHPMSSVQPWGQKITQELKQIEASGLMQKIIDRNIKGITP